MYLIGQNNNKKNPLNFFKKYLSLLSKNEKMTQKSQNRRKAVKLTIKHGETHHCKMVIYSILVVILHFITFLAKCGH